MKYKLRRSDISKRAKVDAVAEIVKRVCGFSQTEAFRIAKDACVFNSPRRSAAGKYAREEA
jgi:hypothetical protein